jgi:transcriptional regulator with XRE-family HTH domain
MSTDKLRVFRSRLRSARERLGLAKTELSKRIGASISVVGTWERGARDPTIDNIFALARELDVSVPWLLGAEVWPDRVSEDRPAQQIASAADVLADYASAPGLRDLAAAGDVVGALGIKRSEWAALASLSVPGASLSRDGYLAVLLAIRSDLGRQRAAARGVPGRPPGSVTKT